jgi:acyl carrier protein
MNIYEELNPLFRRVFDDDNIVVTAETTANDIEEWDSLSHTNLTVVIEKHFKIRFDNLEIQKWKNVGQMVASIEKRLGIQH